MRALFSLPLPQQHLYASAHSLKSRWQGFFALASPLTTVSTFVRMSSSDLDLFVAQTPARVVVNVITFLILGGVHATMPRSLIRSISIPLSYLLCEFMLTCALALNHSASICVSITKSLSLPLVSVKCLIPTHSHTHTLTLTCTCCYDEIKGTQDLKIYSHAHSLILPHSLSLPLVSVFGSVSVSASILLLHSICLARSCLHQDSLYFSRKIFALLLCIYLSL